MSVDSTFKTAVCMLACTIAAGATANAAPIGRGHHQLPRFRPVRGGIAGEYVVNLTDDVEAGGPEVVYSVVIRLAETHRADVQQVWDTGWAGFFARISDADAAALADEAEVESVAQNTATIFPATRSDTAPDNGQWGQDRIDTHGYWANDGIYTYTRDGSGVHVYVMDSGFRHTHSEFAGRVAADGVDEVGGAITTGCLAHGTATAGLVAGATFGTAKRAILHDIRVLACPGQPSYSLWIRDAATWIINNRRSPAVVNMSLANCTSDPIEDDAAQRLLNAGITVIVSAGNISQCGNVDACTVSPAHVGGALTVGATQHATILYDPVQTDSLQGSCVDIFAPGDRLATADPSSDSATTQVSATSPAAAMASGVAAMYLTAHRGRRPQRWSMRSSRTGRPPQSQV